MDDGVFVPRLLSYAAADLKATAKQLGLNTTQFDSCFDKAKYQSEIQADLAQGNKLGVDGTPDVGLWFDYSTNATVAIDNVSFVELVSELPNLTVAHTNGVQIFWSDPPAGTGTAQLQSATNVAGPYFDVAGASSAATASPYNVPGGSMQLFFRTVWIP